jgi:hypothetical protein
MTQNFTQDAFFSKTPQDRISPAQWLPGARPPSRGHGKGHRVAGGLRVAAAAGVRQYEQSASDRSSCKFAGTEPFNFGLEVAGPRNLNTDTT